MRITPALQSVIQVKNIISRRLNHCPTKKLCAVLCILLFTTVVSVSGDDKVTKELFAMDTVMTLTAYGSCAEEGIEQAVSEIQRLDAILSTGNENSEVAGINRRSRELAGAASDTAADTDVPCSFSLSGDVSALLSRSLELWQDTEGAFDITIYPLMRLWGFTDGQYHVPSEEELASILPKTGSEDIVFDKGSGEMSFLEAGMEIDFGGIGKGYTSGRLMQVFRDAGVESALVSLGGNVQALGTKPDGKLWKVAIQNPSGGENYLGIVQVADKAVITSGGYERFFEEDGQTYHHILDPSTGFPARSGLLSVTIVSEDAAMADGLSTALFVQGEESAAGYWRARQDAFDIILYTEDGRLLASSGLRDIFTSDYEIHWIEP